jgi:hypothetical protein
MTISNEEMKNHELQLAAGSCAWLAEWFAEPQPVAKWVGLHGD